MPGCLLLRNRLLQGILLALTVISPTAFAEEPAGVGNFHRVSERLYRGAQPTARGFHSLADLGIKTVIDVREPGKRARWEKKLVESAGMEYVNIPLSGILAPPPEKVQEILALLENPASGPVFLHCKRGSDRTGTLVACYRIAHDGWENRRALREARSLGMRWFEFSMKHYVMNYHIGRREASISATPASAGVVN